MRPLSVSGLAVALIAGLWWALASPAAAEQPAAVQLSVDVIYADGSGQGVDPQLRGVDRQLNRQFRYSTYRLLGQHRLFQAMGQDGRVSLPGGRHLQVLPQGVSDGGAVVLMISIRQGERFVMPNMVLKLANRGTVLVGGPVHEAGVLILAITAGVQ